MITLPIILGVAAAMAGIGLVAVLAWLLYTSYLNRLERRLAYRKGLYRDLVTGLASRDRALLEPQLRELTTLKAFEALEGVLEEQARGATALDNVAVAPRRMTTASSPEASLTKLPGG